MFEVVNYTEAMTSEWNGFVERSKTPNFLFNRGYLDYHSDRFIDSSLIILKHKKIVAIFPCNKVESEIISHGGLTYGGLLVSMELHAPDVLEIISLLCRYFKSLGFSKIIYKAVPNIFNTYPSDESLYALNRIGAVLYRRDLSSVIELGAQPKLSDSRKNTATKAAKAGVSVVESQDIGSFHNLLTSVLTKFNAKPTHSVGELSYLKNLFPEKIRLFNAELHSEVLASAMLYDFGHVVHTQYLASSDIGRKIGALDYMLIKLIDEHFKERRYFSFGISTEDGGKILNEGLIRQKEGFGARGVVHDFYEINL